jgi:ADP-heptose:LPS heptosyltransferase
MLGVMAAAAAVVSVDGALVHAAVGLGRPTLALFGPTDARVWFPYGEFGPYRVLQAKPSGTAGRSSMEALEPGVVLAALETVLGRAEGARRGETP